MLRKECVKAFFVGLLQGVAWLVLVVSITAGIIFLMNILATHISAAIPPIIIFALCGLCVGFFIVDNFEKAGCLTKKESEDYED